MFDKLWLHQEIRKEITNVQSHKFMRLFLPLAIDSRIVFRITLKKGDKNTVTIIIDITLIRRKPLTRNI